jgi:plastocyanin
MMHTHTAVAVAAGTGLLVFALGWSADRRTVPGDRPSTTLVAVQGGTVTGKVKLAGKAPENPAVDMGEEPQCAAKYKTPPRLPLVVVNANGMLANVFVYVKQGLPADAKYPVPTSSVVIDQRGCAYAPRVFGIMVGQTLEIRNSDPLLHNIKTLGKNNRPFNISQPTAGMTLNRTFTAPEVMLRFECNVHGWMRAYAGVLSHPFFATTGTDGSFSIAGLPPGTYTIEAWHEQYGTQTATVTVKDNETTAADFTYTAQ